MYSLQDTPSLPRGQDLGAFPGMDGRSGLLHEAACTPDVGWPPHTLPAWPAGPCTEAARSVFLCCSLMSRSAVLIEDSVTSSDLEQGTLEGMAH